MADLHEAPLLKLLGRRHARDAIYTCARRKPPRRPPKPVDPPPVRSTRDARASSAPRLPSGRGGSSRHMRSAHTTRVATPAQGAATSSSPSTRTA
eukprot:1582433-Prymnesium_polylepis.1